MTIKAGAPGRRSTWRSPPRLPRRRLLPSRRPRRRRRHARAAGPSGPPVIVSIPAFLEKNFIGRDPLKESVLGCTADVTTRLLQLHDALASHKHADLDEVLYVVAGDGVVKLQDRQTPIAAGSLTVVPRGVSHEIERRGKNPLILLSTLAGAPSSAAVIARDNRE